MIFIQEHDPNIKTVVDWNQLDANAANCCFCFLKKQSHKIVKLKPKRNIRCQNFTHLQELSLDGWEK